MKKEKVKALFHKKAVKAGSIAVALMLAAGGLWTAQQQGTAVPELVTFVDTEENVVIEEEEVPLAKPKVTKSTKTTKKTKKIKMKKASKKTYTKAGKTTKKTQTKKTTTSKTNTTTKTETQTKITNKYKKGSKINTRVTTVKTTVTKTVVTKQAASAFVQSVSTVQNDSKTVEQANGVVSVKNAAPKLNSKVAEAFEALHFTVEVNSGVAYSGKFSARSQDIVLKRINDTVYHEFGHFVAFAAGNADMTAEWKNIYNSERSLYTASNKAYVLSSASEYFAESFKEYTLNPRALQAARPQTYAAVEAAVAKITDAQVTAIWNTYQPIWK